MSGITKLLENAIAKVRELPAEDQDAVAVAMLSMAEETPVVALDDETRAAIREGLAQARRGEFVPDEDIEALWRRHGRCEFATRRARVTTCNRFSGTSTSEIRAERGT
ncbi:MAG TPA: hypothetical protein VG291_20720 [Xanthobacteraceae bacterium]|jgi:predicted transcriptional regulator|nr:hypothetical protein [Xanthobacteraceae bacterium]